MMKIMKYWEGYLGCKETIIYGPCNVVCIWSSCA